MNFNQWGSRALVPRQTENLKKIFLNRSESNFRSYSSSKYLKKHSFLPFLARFFSESKYDLFNFFCFWLFWSWSTIQGYKNILEKSKSKIGFNLTKNEDFLVWFWTVTNFFFKIFSPRLSVHVVNLIKQVKILIIISIKKATLWLDAPYIILKNQYLAWMD